ncbi:MAG: ABC transporter ATP-binding protein [Candidatus Marinimicrobia bacterium]|nr:ABC transporter ATP-binding protein [Candidatus Neomarinimicrobiota bacterium]
MNEDNILLKAFDLTKTYFSTVGEVQVLHGITMQIMTKEIVTIVGASGVGKSTLLNLLGALDKPTSGKIEIEGTDISNMDEGELSEFRNKTMGFIFQFHHLLPELSSTENVMLPALLRGDSKKLIMNRASELLSDVGLSHRLHHKPSELSGGERQRVAVARALMNEPKLILADEPAGNLDSGNAESLYKLMWKLKEEREQTFVIVTHNEELAKRADRTIRIEDGRIVN